MIDLEQESILHRVRLRRERTAILRRRRAIAEVKRQIDFETMWADPRRRAASDFWRRVFYQHRPHLYEPVPKTIGRRALVASLGMLLATPVLAQAPDFFGTNDTHRRARLAGASGTKAAGEIGSRVDARNFSTRAHPYRSGSDDAVPIQAAVNHAASIGGATVYLGPGPISLTGSQGIDSPALSWFAPGIVLRGDGPGGTVMTVRYNPKAPLTMATSVVPGITRCSSSISLAMWSDAPYGRATCTAPMVGARCWSR
jgi:hypothetical protein